MGVSRLFPLFPEYVLENALNISDEVIGLGILGGENMKHADTERMWQSRVVLGSG
jgi:hypothetical protein